MLRSAHPVHALHFSTCTGRRTPHTTNCIASSRARRNPPEAVFNPESVALRAYIRQCDPSLPFDWQRRSASRSPRYAARWLFGCRLLVPPHCGTPSLSHLSCSMKFAQSTIFPAANASRIGEPSNLKSLTSRKSSTQGDYFCQLPIVSCCCSFASFSNSCFTQFP